MSVFRKSVFVAALMAMLAASNGAFAQDKSAVQSRVTEVNGIKMYRVAPKYVTTTEQIGRAMIGGASRGYPKSVLETEDINRV